MITTTREESAIATAALAGNNGFSLITNEKLLKLYTTLLKHRLIEERVRDLFERRGLRWADVTLPGSEAATVGVLIDRLPEDPVVSSQADFALSAVKGEPLSEVFRSIFAAAAEPESFDPIEAVMNTARTAQGKKNGEIAIVFCRVESTSLAVWRKAITQAAANRLPILFVYGGNPAREPEKAEAQATPEEIALTAQQLDLPAIPVDGSDLVAVYRVATEAIAHARKGNGATLIHCIASASDSIRKMEVYLNRKGLFSEQLKREVVTSFGRELDAAIEAAGKRATSA